MRTYPDLHLIGDELSLLLTLRIDLLQSVLVSSAGVCDGVDEAKTALRNLPVDAQGAKSTHRYCAGSTRH